MSDKDDGQNPPSMNFFLFCITWYFRPILLNASAGFHQIHLLLQYGHRRGIQPFSKQLTVLDPFNS